MILLAVIVWQFIGVLRLAMNSQNNAYESLRRWFESELKQRDADLTVEKAERMKLETRFDEQCEETDQLKTRIAELEAQIAEKIAEISSLKDDIKHLRQSDEKKDERIREQSERINDLERELKQVKKQRDELIRRLDDLLANDVKSNGGDKKVSSIADRVDERPPISSESDEKKKSRGSDVSK